MLVFLSGVGGAELREALRTSPEPQPRAKPALRRGGFPVFPTPTGRFVRFLSPPSGRGAGVGGTEFSLSTLCPLTPLRSAGCLIHNGDTWSPLSSISGGLYGWSISDVSGLVSS